MRYVSSVIDKKNEDDIYRIYITNALKILTTNTAKFAGGSELVKSFSEIIAPKSAEEEQEQQKDNEEQARDVISMMKSKIAKMGR